MRRTTIKTTRNIKGPAHYCIYARKSTEAEDRQVLSIPAQLDEMRAAAAARHLALVPEWIEAMTAKAPGRPVFGKMMQEIRDGKVDGIICWKLDRLARNPVDGGALIWALDQGQLKEIITPTRTFTNNGDDKFWMQLEFGMAKKYVDDLSVNVKRGIKKKLEQGWRPGAPPIGYLNDKANKTIVADPERFGLVQTMWTMFLTGGHSVADIYRTAIGDWRLRSKVRSRRGGRLIAKSMVYAMFSNSFYCGLIHHNGQTFQGRHPAMISVQEFRIVQRLLGREERRKPEKHDFAFTGMIRCGECGAMVTADVHTKKESGRQYRYYRCTKRKGRCSQPHVRAEELERQMGDFVSGLELASEVSGYLTDELREDEAREADCKGTELKSLETGIVSIQRKMGVLTQLRLDDTLTDTDYREQYNKLVQEKVSLEQELVACRVRGSQETFEPQRAAISFLKLAKNEFQTGTEKERRSVVNIVGSNPTLRDKKLLISAKKPFQLVLERLPFPMTQGKQEEIRTFWNTLGCSLSPEDFRAIKAILAKRGAPEGMGQSVPQI